MSIFFAGDFADPNNGVDYEFIKNLIKKSDAFVFNLEGPILDEKSRNPNTKHKYNLFSHPHSIDNFKDFNLLLSLANNHINDFKNGLQETCNFLDKKGIPYIGIQNKFCKEITVDNNEYCIFSFNSRLTLPYHNKNICTINNHNYKLIEQYKQSNPLATIIVYAHFGLELSKYPMPADREWCKQMINAGANYIIAHHPHVVQGAEEYKDGKIIYSIGNFVLPQTHYLDKKLHYKDPRVNNGIIIEINKNEEPIIHSFQMNPEQTKLNYKGKINYTQLKELFNYDHLTDYITFYKTNNKISKYYPVFKNYNFPVFNIKYAYVLLTQKIRKILIKLNLYSPYLKG